MIRREGGHGLRCRSRGGDVEVEDVDDGDDDDYDDYEPFCA